METWISRYPENRQLDRS